MLSQATVNDLLDSLYDDYDLDFHSISELVDYLQEEENSDREYGEFIDRHYSR